MIQAIRAIKAIFVTVAALAALKFPGAQDTEPLPLPASPQHSVEILSDTEGVDFGPYLKYIVATVRNNWYTLIPASAQTQKGKLAIEFAILKTGQVKNLKLVASSGAAVLDRPAIGSITASDPFKPLPDAFGGPYLALRIRYYYNPDKPDPENAGGPHSGATSAIQSVAVPPIQRAVLIQSAADSYPIKYPRKAIREKEEGIVRVVAEIEPDGGVQGVTPIEGSLLLGGAASEAIRRWRFQPAQQDGKPVKDQVRIRVEFRLDGRQVRWKTLPSELAPQAAPSP